MINRQEVKHLNRAELQLNLCGLFHHMTTETVTVIKCTIVMPSRSHRISLKSTMFPATLNPTSFSFSHLSIRLCQSAAMSFIFRALPVRAEHFLFDEVTVMLFD